MEEAVSYCNRDTGNLTNPVFETFLTVWNSNGLEVGLTRNCPFDVPATDPGRSSPLDVRQHLNNGFMVE